MRRCVAFAVILVIWLVSLEGWACSVCSNPALSEPAPTVSRGRGVRFQAGLQMLFGSVSAGDSRVVDRRAALELGISPIAGFDLALSLPTLFRTVRTPGLASQDRAVLGDFELSARGTLWSSRSVPKPGGDAVVQTLRLVGGVKAPTAPNERDRAGRPLSGVLQPGCNAVTPSLGASYSIRRGVIAFESSAQLYLPFPVRDAPHTAESFRSAVALDLSPLKWISTQTGFAIRAEPGGELSPGTTDPDSGGFVGSITQAITVRPVSTIALSGGVYLPVAQALRGEQHLGPTWRAELTASF